MNPGDIIYVDAGTYDQSTAITISNADSGASNAYVTIQGCTNSLGNATTLRQTTSGVPVVLLPAGTSWIRFADLTVRSVAPSLPGFSDGFRIQGPNHRFERVVVRNQSVGFRLESGHLDLLNCATFGCIFSIDAAPSPGQPIHILNSTLTGILGLSGFQPEYRITNSILHCSSGQIYRFNPVNLKSAHNILWGAPGAPIVGVGGEWH